MHLNGSKTISMDHPLHNNISCLSCYNSYLHGLWFGPDIFIKDTDNNIHLQVERTITRNIFVWNDEKEKYKCDDHHDGRRAFEYVENLL